LSVTAGAAGMYCGTCSRDNALAVELIARGHDVTLLPLYTPTNPDEPNVSRDRVLFGGISIYLQQYVSLFRKTPRLLDRLWDSPRIINAFASRSLSTDPKLLGDMTVSMLEGDRGVLRKEFDKLLEWTADEPAPDVINLSNSLLISLARPLRDAFKRPVCCTLQGEDLFLEELVEPYKTRAIELIRRKVADVETFIAVSDYYVPVMARLLAVPESRIAVVPLGINMKGYVQRPPRAGSGDVFRVGYFARIAPEKGLHFLAQAYQLFRRKVDAVPHTVPGTVPRHTVPGTVPQTVSGTEPRIRLEAAGYLGRAHTGYLEEVKRQMAAAGLGSEFTYHGAVDRDGKLAFLQTLDLLSVPATYDEPKGVFLLEAMASGVPVVQPRRGSFTEMVEKTGGGLLVKANDPAALADGLFELWQDRAKGDALGARGFQGVREHYSVAHSADIQLDIYESMIAPPRVRQA
jgi:glycosyltransferase involved in cell wall biosynthesis